MIEFQNDDAFKVKLEACIGEIQVKIQNGVEEKTMKDSEEIKKLTKILNDRFNMLFVIEVNSPHVAAVLPFYPNRNHTLLNKMWRGGVINDEQIKTLARAKKQFGSVNTEKATVDGSFSKAENFLYLNFTKFFNVIKLTIPETASVILHEIGHAFYACEYADRLETNNLIISEAMRYAVNKKEKADKRYIYEEIERTGAKLDMSEVDVLTSDDKVISGNKWFAIYVRSVEAQMGEGTYDKTAFEAAADNFASRFGYGRDLVTGLDKLIRSGWFQYPTTANMVIINIYWLFMMESLFASVAFDILLITKATAWTKLGASISLLKSIGFGLILTNASATHTRDMTYDELKDRYKRIRNQYIENLKDPSVSSDMTADAVDAIKMIDGLVTDMSKIPQINRILADIIIPASRRAKQSIEDQRFIEDLISNDIFVKAAQLRV